MSGTILCFEDYRSRPGDEQPRPAGDPPPVSPFARFDDTPDRPLSARQLAHRRRMLEHLLRRAVS